MARILVLLNSVGLLLFGSEMFLVGASKFILTMKHLSDNQCSVLY